MTRLAVIALGLVGLLFSCHRAPSAAPTRSSPPLHSTSAGGRTPSPTANTPREAPIVALAGIITSNARGSVWASGAVLGAFDFTTGEIASAVTMPRGEPVACTCRSEDGSLLAAMGANGSVALWDQRGTLISQRAGTSPVESCSDDDFAWSGVTQRVYIGAGKGSAPLLGNGLAVALPFTTIVPRGKFIQNGQRLLVELEEDKISAVDATDGRVIGEFPGSLTYFAISDNGRYFATRLYAGKNVDLYDASTLTRVQSVEGEEPGFHLDFLVVRVGPADELSDSVAYTLQPFRQRWHKREIAIYDENQSGDNVRTAGPWRVGMSGKGYSVFDVRTGSTLAAWRSSGYGCGYQWAWEANTLAFIEGDLLTFWKQAVGAKTHQTRCEGALTPIFTKDRSRFLGLDGIWDIKARRRIATIETRDATISHFSKDERLVLGTAPIGDSLEIHAAAWDANTGRLVWHHKWPETGGDPLDNPAWRLGPAGDTLIYFDEAEQQFYWVAIVVNATQGAQLLVFNQHCWAGPAQLPDREDLPREMPSQQCPELLTKFRAQVRSPR